MSVFPEAIGTGSGMSRAMCIAMWRITTIRFKQKRITDSDISDTGLKFV